MLKIEINEIAFKNDPDAIKDMMNSYKKNPGAIYGIMGLRNGNYMHIERVPTDYDYFVVDILGGYRGVLYNVGLIDREKFYKFFDEIEALHRKANLIAMHDDFIFAYFFKMQRIERRVASSGKISPNIHYLPIPNSDGITVDPNGGKSLDILHQYLKENELSWVISNLH
jgi:hypothetical protein